jgi:hypothetical protein
MSRRVVLAIFFILFVPLSAGLVGAPLWLSFPIGLVSGWVGGCFLSGRYKS